MNEPVDETIPTSMRLVEKAVLPPYNEKAWAFNRGYPCSGVRAWECTVQGALDEDSLSVETADGKVLRKGVDYIVDANWGAVGLIGDAAKTVREPVTLSYRYALRRIDSLMERDGKTYIRRGIPHLHLCEAPVPEPGEKRLVNYYHTKSGVEEFPVLESASEARRTPPGAASSAPRTLEKLRNGEPVRILAWGDSVTECSYLIQREHWQNQFVERLGARFPKAKIELVSNGWGGRNTSNFLSEPSGSKHNYAETVLAVRPDLVISEFVNDAGLSEEVFKANYTRILGDFREIGAEWIVLTPHYVRMDWMGLESQRNCSDDPRPYVAWLRSFARENGIGLADASLRWGHLWKEGIPYETLFDNDINHPNAWSMSFFADALMDYFG